MMRGGSPAHLSSRPGIREPRSHDPRPTPRSLRPFRPARKPCLDVPASTSAREGSLHSSRSVTAVPPRWQGGCRRRVPSYSVRPETLTSAARPRTAPEIGESQRVLAPNQRGIPRSRKPPSCRTPCSKAAEDAASILRGSSPAATTRTQPDRVSRVFSGCRQNAGRPRRTAEVRIPGEELRFARRMLAGRRVA